MSFLTPVFLAGAAAVAIPILIHLIQRERKQIIAFPSLMFIRRIPYQSVRRRKIRHWLLLAMRVAAILLIVAAFARPFFRQGAIGVGTALAREVVIVLDRSASMGYGDHWPRAQAAARQVVSRLGAQDRATLVLFANNAEENIRSTSDRAKVAAAIEAAKVGSGATRFGPALKLAQSVLARSALKRREAVLISDFQKTGWSGSDDLHLPEGTTLTPMSIAGADTSNLSVSTVTFSRASFSGKERITVTAGLNNRGTGPIRTPVSLEIAGEPIQSQPVDVAANASASVAFTPFTLTEPNLRGTVRAGTDALPQDNAFHLVLSPGRPVPVLIVDRGDTVAPRVSPSLYLSKALAIGTAPSFEVQTVAAARLAPEQLDKPAIVILNDTPFPPGAASGGALRRFVERGGGVLVVLGESTTWPASDAALLPGRLGAIVDPAQARGATLGFVDYSHPAFELFKAPRSGDFSGTRVFRYRALAPEAGDRVLARFDDGGVAAAERRAGQGRVVVWGATLDDSWSDLAVKPVFLPLVHQLSRYLARYEDAAAWYTVGQALDVVARVQAKNSDRIVLTPSGRRLAVNSAEGPGFVELNEQGFYDVRIPTESAARPLTVAVDLDPAESDLTAMDPQELVAAATGSAGQASAAAVPPDATSEDVERRQALWWYLLAAGLLLLAAETVLSNRLSERGKTA